MGFHQYLYAEVAVRPGRNPDEEPLGGKCVNCLSVVRCTRKDVSVAAEDYDSRTYRYVLCPTCRQRIYVHEGYDFSV